MKTLKCEGVHLHHYGKEQPYYQCKDTLVSRSQTAFFTVNSSRLTGWGAHEFYTFKKLLLTPIITHPRLGGSLNRNCIVHVPDPFFPPPYKRKKWSGYARLRIHLYTKCFIVVIACAHIHNTHTCTHACIYTSNTLGYIHTYT